MPRGSSHPDDSKPARRALRSSVKVLPEHARSHNRVLALQTLYHQGAMTRADLARETGLTRVTISDMVSDLIADGIVKEGGRREPLRPGKPGTLIDLDRTGHQIIGLDLSGDEFFEGAVMDLEGSILRREAIARPVDDDGQTTLEMALAIAADLVAAADRPVLGVGIAAQGVVSPAGVVLRSPNLGWTDLPLQQCVTEALGVPVIVSNDADSAALAQYTFGGARSDFMLITFGRGVGAGLISGGQPLVGSRFAAGEIGHVVVGTDPGPLCACGRSGCLEAWVNVGRLTGEVAEHPERREQILRDAGARLAIGIAPIVAALDLSEIVLSGPAELLEGPFRTAAAETLRARTLEGFFDDVSFVVTTQHDIVLLGAAVTVLSDQLGIS